MLDAVRKGTAKPDLRACKVKNKRNLIYSFAMFALIAVLIAFKEERKGGR